MKRTDMSDQNKIIMYSRASGHAVHDLTLFTSLQEILPIAIELTDGTTVGASQKRTTEAKVTKITFFLRNVYRYDHYSWICCPGSS